MKIEAAHDFCVLGKKKPAESMAVNKSSRGLLICSK